MYKIIVMLLLHVVVTSQLAQQSNGLFVFVVLGFGAVLWCHKISMHFEKSGHNIIIHQATYMLCK